MDIKTRLAQEFKLKAELGKAISIIPDKSERWLMLNFTENEFNFEPMGLKIVRGEFCQIAICLR